MMFIIPFTIFFSFCSITFLILNKSVGFINDDTLLEIIDCVEDENCANWELCRNYQCFDGCIDNRCGLNAYCVPINHTHTCKCLDDFDGDPNKKCFYKCFDNSDCNDHQFCRENICVYACDHVKCAKNALCTANNHTPNCQCKFCYEGYGTKVCRKKKSSYCLNY